MVEKRHGVAIIINSAHPRPGGLESHVHQLSRRLASRGVPVRLFSLHDGPEAMNEDGNVRHLRLPMLIPIGSVFSLPPLGTTKKILRMLVDEDIAAVTSHTRFFPMTFVAWRVSRKLGVPLIHSEHGSDFVRSQNLIMDFCARLVDVSMGAFLLMKADRIVADSKPVANFVYKISQKPAVIMENAIDIDWWVSDSDSEKLEKQSASLGNRFVFVGRMVPGKGWDTFLNIVSEVAGSFDSVDMYGEGPDLEKAKLLAGELNLGKVVNFHGNVGAERLRKALRGGIYINPSQLSEGFQITVLEALAAGAKVVTYPVPSAESILAKNLPIWVSSRRDATQLKNLLLEAVSFNYQAPTSKQLQEWNWPTWITKYENLLKL